MKKRILFFSLLAILITSFTQICHAQLIIEDRLGPSTVWELLDLIFRWLFWLSIPITVIMILIAAITLITSSGEKEKLKKAKDTILYALLGFSIVILANGIPPLIMQIISSGSQKQENTCASQGGQCIDGGNCTEAILDSPECTSPQVCCEINTTQNCNSLGGTCTKTEICNASGTGSWGYKPDCSSGETCCKSESEPISGCNEDYCPGCKKDEGDAYMTCMDKCAQEDSTCIAACEYCFDYSS